MIVRKIATKNLPDFQRVTSRSGTEREDSFRMRQHSRIPPVRSQLIKLSKVFGHAAPHHLGFASRNRSKLVSPDRRNDKNGMPFMLQDSQMLNKIRYSRMPTSELEPPMT
jgi:hypothetical protein